MMPLSNEHDQPSSEQHTDPIDSIISSDQPASGAAPVEPSIFADAGALLLSQSFTDLGVKRVYGASCRKPPRQEFVRVNKDPSMTMVAALISLREEMDGGNYLVHPALLSEMQAEVKQSVLYTSITRGGDLFLWPIAMPSDTNKSSRRWSQSAIDAAEAAKDTWIRVYANTAQGQYEWMLAAESEAIGPPAWPEGLTREKILELSFKDHIITSLDHKVVKALRGRL